MGKQQGEGEKQGVSAFFAQTISVDANHDAVQAEERKDDADRCGEQIGPAARLFAVIQPYGKQPEGGGDGEALAAVDMGAGKGQYRKVKEGEAEGNVLKDMQIRKRAFAFRQRGKVENEQIQSAAETDKHLLSRLVQKAPKVNINQAQQGETEAKNQHGRTDEKAVEQSVENKAVSADGEGNIRRALR